MLGADIEGVRKIDGRGLRDTSDCRLINPESDSRRPSSDGCRGIMGDKVLRARRGEDEAEDVGVKLYEFELLAKSPLFWE
jgi:hypothetical protein